MCDLSTSADDVILGLLNDVVRRIGILEPNNGRFALIDSESAGDHGEGGGQESDGTHDDGNEECQPKGLKGWDLMMRQQILNKKVDDFGCRC